MITLNVGANDSGKESPDTIISLTFDGGSQELLYFFGKSLYALENFGYSFVTSDVYDACKLELNNKMTKIASYNNKFYMSHRVDQEIIITIKVTKSGP